MPDRRGEHLQRHLARFSSVLQADAFAGYAPLYEDRSFREAACMAHARPKIYDLHAVAPMLLQKKLCAAWASVIAQKPKSEADQRTSDGKCDRHGPHLASKRYGSGTNQCCQHSPRSSTPPARFSTPLTAGPRSHT
jgi:hypothetical protein